MHIWAYTGVEPKEEVTTLFSKIYGQNGARSTKAHWRGLAVRGEREVGTPLRGCSEQIVKTTFLARMDSGYCAYSIGLRDLENSGFVRFHFAAVAPTCV